MKRDGKETLRTALWIVVCVGIVIWFLIAGSCLPQLIAGEGEAESGFSRQGWLGLALVCLGILALPIVGLLVWISKLRDKDGGQ